MERKTKKFLQNYKISKTKTKITDLPLFQKDFMLVSIYLCGLNKL